MPLRFDSPIAELGCTTEAPKALHGAGIDTIGQLIALTEDNAKQIKGLGEYRLADVKAAMAKNRLRFATAPLIARRCDDCPVCPGCGNPRATEPKQVVADVAGRFKHTGEEVLPTCDDCDAHHRSLFAGAAPGRAVRSPRGGAHAA